MHVSLPKRSGVPDGPGINIKTPIVYNISVTCGYGRTAQSENIRIYAMYSDKLTVAFAECACRIRLIGIEMNCRSKVFVYTHNEIAEYGAASETVVDLE